LDALLKKFIAENDDETQVIDSDSSSSSDDDDETEVPKPDLHSLKIVPPRSRAVVMVRNGSKQGNTVSDLMAATPTRRSTSTALGLGSPSRLSQGFWRNSATKTSTSKLIFSFCDLLSGFIFNLQL